VFWPRGYANRSEAIRDLARSGPSQSDLEVAHDRDCIATLSYVYDHAICRPLAVTLARSAWAESAQAARPEEPETQPRSTLARRQQPRGRLI
jgi:hypothetical protein